jgi:HPt (histidine-containing phosphotransfer) domain-containing protein
VRVGKYIDVFTSINVLLSTCLLVYLSTSMSITKGISSMSTIDQTTFNELKQMSGADFINELIDAFLEDAPTMIQNMHTALQTKDVESFRRNAHSLKSNANTFGATELALLAKELEFMARENNLNVGTRLDILNEAFGKVAEELRGMRT